MHLKTDHVCTLLSLTNAVRMGKEAARKAKRLGSFRVGLSRLQAIQQATEAPKSLELGGCIAALLLDGVAHVAAAEELAKRAMKDIDGDALKSGVEEYLDSMCTQCDDGSDEEEPG